LRLAIEGKNIPIQCGPKAGLQLILKHFTFTTT